MEGDRAVDDVKLSMCGAVDSGTLTVEKGGVVEGDRCTMDIESGGTVDSGILTVEKGGCGSC